MIIFLISISIMTVIGLIFGLLLTFADVYYKIDIDPIIKNIDNILPQSQCGQCGYPGCYSYAEAIINSNENINKCIPGGKIIIIKLAELLNISLKNIEIKSITNIQQIAFINEENCIGCTKCIQICPVDAIVGAKKVMHTVIKDFCTGCNLCISKCPTKCIDLLEINNNV